MLAVIIVLIGGDTPAGVMYWIPIYHGPRNVIKCVGPSVT